MKILCHTIWISILLLCLQACISNNPYRKEEADKNYRYSTFTAPPKHLDPATSYSAGEWAYTTQIYEPPLQYHFLKRPYELIPLTAAEIPQPVYYNKNGSELAGDPPPDQIARAVYTVRIKPGISYQNHPCFARDKNERLLYHDLTDKNMADISDIGDFPHTGTQELTAADYVYQIKRFAHPANQCPIFSTMAKYILGLDELNQKLNSEWARLNREKPERIWLDLNRFDFPGAQVIDRYTYQITLKTKYPQFLYWLAMPFFTSIPREVDAFFAQAPMVERNLNLDNRPVGTGAYRMERFLPNKEIVLVKNENVHPEFYPDVGEPQDRELGLLTDAGKPLPFIEKAIFKLEKEAIPRWSKFLQGYFEASAISTEVFDQAIQMDEGGLELSDEMQTKGVQLSKAVRSSTAYFAFNMQDEIVGGYTKDKQKLRQALSIVINIDEYIQIFLNGRGIPAHDIIPPGIFGHQKGKEGINPYIYGWDNAQDKPVAKPLDHAKKLLTEAGYPDGKDQNGVPLVLYFDTYWNSASTKPRLDWLRKQFRLLNIDLQFRSTDNNRFRDKLLQGNFQILFWGWNADYPDPENFLFLHYGPNGAAKYGGENVCNYQNPEFDRLFKQVESMENGPARLDLIAQMTEILRKDAPMAWGYHPVLFSLYHEWYTNPKPMIMGRNTLKYRNLNHELRAAKRVEWNRPIWWPIALGFAVLIAGTLPAVMSIKKREREGE